jgi:hypothetical protein
MPAISPKITAKKLNSTVQAASSLQWKPLGAASEANQQISGDRTVGLRKMGQVVAALPGLASMIGIVVCDPRARTTGLPARARRVTPVKAFARWLGRRSGDGRESGQGSFFFLADFIWLGCVTISVFIVSDARMAVTTGLPGWNFLGNLMNFFITSQFLPGYVVWGRSAKPLVPADGLSGEGAGRSLP